MELEQGGGDEGIKSMVTMALQKMQEIMTELAAAVGYGYEAPAMDTTEKGVKMLTDADLEKQINGLVEDLSELHKAVKEFVAEKDTVTAGIPDEVVKAIEELTSLIPTKAEIEKMINTAVEAALKETASA